MKRIILMLVLSFLSVGANAALIDRGEGFIYDDVLDVTWAQNANINGVDTWANQMAWAAGYSQTHTVYGTFDDWRLPTTLQPDASCDVQSGGVSSGLDCTGSEMGHLFNVDGISSFGTHNLYAINYYWSGTVYAPAPSAAWFDGILTDGWQGYAAQTQSLYALAVRDGDIAPIPEPSAAVLLGLGLSGLAASGRRRNRS